MQTKFGAKLWPEVGEKFFLPGEGLGLFPWEWETLVGALIIHGLGEVPAGRPAYQGSE